MNSDPGLEAGPLEPEQALERVSEAAHGPLHRFWDGIEAGTSTVVQAVREARDGHARLVAACGLGEDGLSGAGAGPEADPCDAREALRRYRHGVMAEVLEPLERAFRLQPTRQIGEAVAAACQEAHQRASELPVRPAVRWGAGALEPMPGDGRSRRVRKALARWVSPARKADRTRPAPLRAVALRHVRDRTAPLLDDFGPEAFGAWAAWLLALERASADWSERAFPALCWVDVENGPPPSLLSDTDVPAPAASGGNGASGSDAPGNGAPASEEGPWDRAHRRVARAARTFDDALAAALEASPHAAVRERAQAASRDALHALSSDVRAVGSLVHRPKGAVSGAPLLPHLERARKNLAGWDEQGAARIGLYRAFLGVLAGSAAVEERLAGNLRDVVLDPVHAVSADAAALDALADEARRSRRAVDPDRLEHLRQEATARVHASLASLPEAPAVEEALGGAVDRSLESFQGIVRQLPERVGLHRVETRAPETLRAPDTRVVTLQEAARQSLDALRVERMRTGVLDLARRYGGIRISVAELPDVIAFAFDAARKELDEGEGTDVDAAPEEAPDGDEGGPPLHPTTAFAVEALERAADVLRSVPSDVRAAVRQAEAHFAGEVAAGETALHQRLLAGRVTSQIFRARSVFAEALTGLEERFGPGWSRIHRRLRIVRKRTERTVGPAVRWIRTLVGDGAPPAGRAQRTLRAFAQEDSGPGHVPLVYQRLFALSPVADGAFLVGREGEVAEVLDRFRRWREEDEVPVVVRGLPGRGVSSFLKAVGRAVTEEGAAVREIELPERILDEAALVPRLAEVLGVEGVASLEALASTVLASPRGSVPDAVIVDGLEHLYLRVPGGTDLLERFLTFLSETEPRVFWVAGISQPAWKLIGMAEPFAVLQVHDLELGALSAERLRETVLRRHRRSGLRLRFAEPREGRALLRRRLRRLRGTDAHQAVLADDFFVQLHRAALGDLKLALFHWMLAADFEATEGEVLMRPPLRPDFDILETLRPAQQYTLKAFLEHRTLTLVEHDAIFRMPHQESYQLFESLQNRHLIEELDTRAAWERGDSEIRRTSRYRIRPLLVGAVIEHLGTRNIVH